MKFKAGQRWRYLTREGNDGVLAEVRRRLRDQAKQPSEIPDLEARETQLYREIQRLTAAILIIGICGPGVVGLCWSRQSQLGLPN